MERFDRENLNEIPVVESSVEEIPEGLFLLPAPRPISRLRTAALAAVAVAMGCGSILIAVLGGDSMLGGDGRAPASTDGEATLASAEVPGGGGNVGADPVDGDAGTGIAATPARRDDHEGARAEARAEPAEAAATHPTASPVATEAAGGVSAYGGEGAATASEPPSTPAAPPADSAQPEPVLPDPSETVDQLGDLVDQVTDSLPFPDLIGGD